MSQLGARALSGGHNPPREENDN